ncbi:MAG: hypothetical protein M5U09_09585 [Gammaproteobacteria bacterium]|nr:hypothetical protein [Gammaproteobacteria bacterium]
MVLAVTLPAHAQTSPANDAAGPPGPRPRVFRGALQFLGLATVGCSGNDDAMGDAISAGEITIVFELFDDDTFTITFEPFGSLTANGTLEADGSFDVSLAGSTFAFGTATGCMMTVGNASGMLSPDGTMVSGEFEGTTECEEGCLELDVTGTFELAE